MILTENEMQKYFLLNIQNATIVISETVIECFVFILQLERMHIVLFDLLSIFAALVVSECWDSVSEFKIGEHGCDYIEVCCS